VEFEATTVSDEVATPETVTGEMKQAESTKVGNNNGSQATVQAVTSDDICKRKWDLIALVAEIGKAGQK